MKKIAVLVLCSILLICNISYGEYIDNGNGTITDSSTGLTWQEHGTYGSYSREYANTYAEQLSTGGYTNWRLPNSEELWGIQVYIIEHPSFTGEAIVWTNEEDQNGFIAIVFWPILDAQSPIRKTYVDEARIWAVRNPPWYSSDPNDFIPLRNTVWEFEWEHNYIDYSDIVTFDTNITVGDDKIALLCHNDMWNGCVFYGDFPSNDERGFICTLSDTPPTNVFVTYQFNINNGTAIGDFVYLDLSDPSKFNTDILIGTKILSDIDQNQPVELDQNQTVDVDQNQPVQIDQNQPIDSVPTTNNQSSDGGGDGGGCFIALLL